MAPIRLLIGEQSDLGSHCLLQGRFKLFYIGCKVRPGLPYAVFKEIAHYQRLSTF